jgi:hypothetical protein
LTASFTRTSYESSLGLSFGIFRRVIAGIDAQGQSLLNEPKIELIGVVLVELLMVKKKSGIFGWGF